MATRSFDGELAALEALRHADPATTEAALRKALGSRNNFLVSKAARLVAEHGHRGLIPVLVEVFPQFAKDPYKTDPQCWAKEAILRALAEFEYQEPELFLEGIRTLQPGPTDDAATALRGLSALALVQCRGLSSHDVLLHLLPLFADAQLPVRVNVARAVEQIGTPSAALLLRMRAELASDRAELLGACYGGVLRIEGAAAIPWVAKFLPKGREEADAAHEEAALSLAETRTEAAVVILKQQHQRAHDRSFRDTLLTALALTRQDSAIDYLFGLVAEGSAAARRALEDTAPTAATLERLRGR